MEWNLIVLAKILKNQIFEVMAPKLNESLILELLIKGKIKIKHFSIGKVGLRKISF
jgi:hypothetical protein